MKALIQKVPVPIAGLTLGLTALGNLIAGLSPALHKQRAIVFDLYVFPDIQCYCSVGNDRDPARHNA